ncbi:MAG: triose-phosphate isomerase [Candidatus Vogelbacteria bacterium CG10_big_fil_rev_8_21_14_0_10_51_16]|uniref:Triosephosphate isomerase n=1 Tax=Candidatus Vogelbacteria bacterium CG10_big_fil_rev_8_21_14_0_10_51_16 TaxID=1975045 RepID=A0A2H0RF44_9BACT|nr:MAG: triose-phosphate isomerase [Candidatus Vogelbacteria bacterium CG10_big_fil_rev_8_21_14_0_10_51_16]
MAQKKIVVANWKMAPDTLKEAKALYLAERKTATGLRRVQTIICPPVIYLHSLSTPYALRPTPALGAQSCFHLKSGAHTGALSAEMMARAGARYVLVGHSERRAEGESSVQVAMQVNAVFDAGATPILCVGERERDEHGFFLKYLEDQLIESLHGVSKKRIGMLIIAYEPLWAISSEQLRPATPKESEQMALYLRKLLASKIGLKAAREALILYGGSVDVKNCEAFLREGGVGGLLVGRASLDAKQFGEILKIAERAPQLH